MATVNETKWLAKYQQLKDYVEQHHQLPDKKKVENRGLLNWWKYNKKLIKQGRLPHEQLLMLQQLNEMRTKSNGSLVDIASSEPSLT